MCLRVTSATHRPREDRTYTTQIFCNSNARIPSELQKASARFNTARGLAAKKSNESLISPDLESSVLREVEHERSVEIIEEEDTNPDPEAGFT